MIIKMWASNEILKI